jgi:EAL domain-containing protein (putative c-di-GMP-specific phosphodiesterase class I)
MKTIAEFVENERLRDALKKMNVDYVQGYGIAKPVPLSSYI